MLFVNHTGNGVPLVFIHAFPLSSQMWEGNRPAFSKNFQFITVDLPGFGRSPLAKDTSTMEDMAAGVVSALDHMNIKEKVVLAGLSMGGYVMIQVLKMIPNRVRATAFLSTRSAPDTAQAREKRFKIIDGIEKNGLGFLSERMIPSLFGKSSLADGLSEVALVKGWIESANPQAVCAALRGMAVRPDMTSFVSSLSIPALVLSGEEDTVIAPADMREMAQMIAKSEFHVLPRAGHLFNIEQPRLFEELFLHFLKRSVL